MSDRFENHIVGFLMRRLNWRYFSELVALILSIIGALPGDLGIWGEGPFIFRDQVENGL